MEQVSMKTRSAENSNTSHCLLFLNGSLACFFLQLFFIDYVFYYLFAHTNDVSHPVVTTQRRRKLKPRTSWVVMEHFLFSA